MDPVIAQAEKNNVSKYKRLHIQNHKYLLTLLVLFGLIIGLSITVILSINSTRGGQSRADQNEYAFGKALQLTSNKQGVQIKGEKSITQGYRFNLQEFTLEGFVKLEKTPTQWPRVIFKVNDDQPKSIPAIGSVVLSVSPGVDSRPKNELDLTVQIGISTPGINPAPLYIHVSCGQGLSDMRWHHIALTSKVLNNQPHQQKDQLTVFVDGINTCSTPTGGIHYDYYGNNNLYLGMDLLNGGNILSFSGQIDEVRYSNQVRYTDNFTPAMMPFGLDGATTSLLHLDGNSLDSVTNTQTTVFGSPNWPISTIGLQPSITPTLTPSSSPTPTTAPTPTNPAKRCYYTVCPHFCIAGKPCPTCSPKLICPSPAP